MSPVSPTGQCLNSSVLSMSILGVWEFEIPINESKILSFLQDVFLNISPRFSSIMRGGDSGSIFRRVSETSASVFDTVKDFSWNSLFQDDCTPIRSRNYGVEFLPMIVSSITLSLDEIKLIKNKLNALLHGARWHVGDVNYLLGCPAVTGLPSWILTPFADWVPNWNEPLTVLGVGFPVGIGLRFLLDLGCPTCVNAGLLFILLHIENLTSLLSSLREILENLYCLSKRGVAVHPKWVAAVVGHVCADGPAAAYHHRPGLQHVGPRALQASSTKSVLPDYPSKRKVDVKSLRNEAANSLAKDASPLRKKPRIPYAEKTKVRAVSSSSTRVKDLVCVDSRKVGGMRGVCCVLPEPSTDKLENHDILREAARARSSYVERQRDADIPPRSSSRLPRSKDGHRSRRSAHDLAVESRAIKRGVDSVSLTPLEVRLAEDKKMRASSAQAKGSSVSAVDPKVNKSSPAGDACVSDLLKTDFLSNPSSCAELVDHIFFVAETIRNSYAVAPSSAADLVSRKDAYFCLERKNADVSFSCDKLLARFHAYHKSAEKSKSEAIIDAYKLGYLHCADRTTPLYAIDDVNIETLCPDSPPVEGGAEEQAAREDEAEEDAVDEMMADVAEQADGAIEGLDDQAEAEEAAAQRSPTGVPE
ncbi:unnamed protein product [Prunus armeniaca]